MIAVPLLALLARDREMSLLVGPFWMAYTALLAVGIWAVLSFLGEFL